MSSETLAASRFFRIRGGDTVVEAQPSGWIRWDRWDGPVETSIWSVDSPELEEISEPEARKIIGEFS